NLGRDHRRQTQNDPRSRPHLSRRAARYRPECRDLAVVCRAARRKKRGSDGRRTNLSARGRAPGRNQRGRDDGARRQSSARTFGTRGHPNCERSARSQPSALRLHQQAASHDRVGMNLQIFADEERIEQVVVRLAAEIREAYADKKPPLLVAVPNGSVIFASDLVRRLPADYELAFVSVCSYDGENSTTELRFRMDLEIPLDGRDVLILEDIVDTGLTLRALIEEFERRGAASVKSAVLILKQARLKTDRLPDFVGF